VVAVPAAGGTVAVPARQRQYRGVMEATAATGTLRLVNAVDVEQYLAGMGEVRDPSWPPAALRAQAIAARTYALRAMTTGGEICDTQRCQVYLGAQAEFAAMSAAVSATREQVLVYQRALISAVYSANGGGHSASREEGFGVTDAGLPYLRPAPYPTKDPGPWTARVALGDIAARLAYPGTLTDVRTTRVGPSGRVLELVLDGTAGRLATTGIAFDAALGLRSTLFTVRVESAAAPPPPPPAEAAVAQAPPEEAAAAAAIETAAAEDDTGAAAGAHRALEPSMEARRSPGRRYAPMILAGWSMLAVTGAAGVATAGVLERNRTRSGSSLTPKRRWRRRPRRVPSPSAPPGGDASG
jgi:SpoIID/LytB domain protein